MLDVNEEKQIEKHMLGLKWEELHFASHVFFK